jgi:sialate O-acetylesterase
MRGKLFFKSFLFIVSVVLISCQSEVEITLPKIINSNMVVQRNQEVKIWGWGSGQGKVKVTINGQTKIAKVSDDSTWMVSLDPMEAGGPFEMMIIGLDTTILDNVLIGDVWVCSGQSNMEWPLVNTNDAEAEILGADYPEIRLFTVPKNIPFAPADDIPGGAWEICSPETVPDFSAVGFFFGKEIHKEMGIPIGLINTSWGGTNVETWISSEMCAEDEEMAKMIAGIAGLDIEGIKKKKEEEMKQVRKSLGALEYGIVDGDPIWAAENLDLSAWKKMEVPGLWEAKGLNGLDGVVWFRREFTLNKAQAGKAITVNLGAIDDSDLTWVNGVLIGETEQKYSDDRSYIVKPGLAKEGINQIVVRIEDTGGGGGFWGDPASMLVKTILGNVPLAGDWNFRASAADIKITAMESFGPNDMPTLLYNGMINPIINFSVQGAIWYQGESNTGNAFKYRTRFPNMIQDWRNKWNNQDLGFYFVQLANFMESKPDPAGSTWAELREAQTMTLSLENTGMAVIIDIGEAGDIHPRNKKDVGYRLALAALHETYDKDIVYSGPVYKSMAVDGEKVSLEFDHVGAGLVSRDGSDVIGGFAVAGEDQQYYWAEGKIVDNKVILWSSEVANPVAVRYAWADNPDTANLYNKEGLPAGPFRTDTWKLITE